MILRELSVEILTRAGSAIINFRFERARNALIFAKRTVLFFESSQANRRVRRSYKAPPYRANGEY